MPPVTTDDLVPGQIELLQGAGVEDELVLGGVEEGLLARAGHSLPGLVRHKLHDIGIPGVELGENASFGGTGRWLREGICPGDLSQVLPLHLRHVAEGFWGHAARAVA